MTCIQIRVFPVRVVYNEPTNSCRSSLVVGWETESTAPSTATIQPRSAVAVLEAEHVAPHAKPPWHSFRFHKNSVQDTYPVFFHMRIEMQKFLQKYEKQFDIHKQNSHFWTPKKLLVAHGEVPGGELPQVECHQPPNPRTPKSAPHRRKSKCHKSGERSGASPMVQRLSL